MCTITDGSTRPASILKTHLAALSHLYHVMDMHDVTRDTEIAHLHKALIKSSTHQPCHRTAVLPIQPFMNLFRAWGFNDSLSVSQLRLKTIVLLALSVMLRPSDIAPRAKLFNPTDPNSPNLAIFSTDQLEFHPDGSCDMFFHGIKQDSDRSGFQVHLPSAVDPLIDPVLTLHTYIQRTAPHRPPGHNPVFITLTVPYRAITADTVSHILSEAITLAGLGGRGFSVKSFRPTGATAAINKGHYPKMVQRLGRWKTETVFLEHYVHSRTPQSYTTDLFSHA